MKQTNNAILIQFCNNGTLLVLYFVEYIQNKIN